MALYNYALANRASGTGTVSHSNTANVTGTDTAFTTELAVGDVIEIAGTYRLVATITDNTHLTVGTAYTDTVSGESFAYFPLQNVEDLIVPGETGRGANVPTPAPRSQFWSYSQPIPLASGGVRGAGFPRAEWRWDYLAQMSRDRLRLFSLNKASDLVAVRTRTNEAGFTGQPVYKTFVGELLWPAEEPKQTGVLPDFTLRFVGLELVGV